VGGPDCNEPSNVSPMMFRCRSLNGIRNSRHSRRRLPPSRLHIELAFGARAGVRGTRIPMFATAWSSFGEDVPVVDQEAVGMVTGWRLPVRLPRSVSGGMSGHVVMENSPRRQLHDHEYVTYSVRKLTVTTAKKSHATIVVA
jgi:hypothetical protein